MTRFFLWLARQRWEHAAARQKRAFRRLGYAETEVRLSSAHYERMDAIYLAVRQQTPSPRP